MTEFDSSHFVDISDHFSCSVIFEIAPYMRAFVNALAPVFIISTVTGRLSGPHRGHHAKIFGWAKSSTSDLWPISHDIGIGEWDKQKSLCDVCNIR